MAWILDLLIKWPGSALKHKFLIQLSPCRTDYVMVIQTTVRIMRKRISKKWRQFTFFIIICQFQGFHFKNGNMIVFIQIDRLKNNEVAKTDPNGCEKGK